MTDIDDKDDEDDEDDDDQHVGSVCGDYREHQVTSSALRANDRAPMNRRKKSRQTDSFGIDRKELPNSDRQIYFVLTEKYLPETERQIFLIFLPFS